MIPEAAGATPYGIFLLADDYLRSARSAAADDRMSSKGPVRLLSYHAAELFLKCYLRSAGETIEALRTSGHDLASLLKRAQVLGLKLPPRIAAQANKMKRKNDYVRVRYVVVEERTDILVDSVLRLTETIRASVVEALGFSGDGVRQGNTWLGEAPADSPVAGSARRSKV
jgi:hypothetical protein